MKKVLILRHAKSSWKSSGLSDHDRPLNKRGKRAAPRMGQLIYEEDIVPDIILSSTARRARDTAELVAEACGFEGEIICLEDFYHAWTSDYIDGLRSIADVFASAMVVGHNPGMEMLLEQLAGETERFPTAALAVINLPIDFWSQLNDETEGELVQFSTPRDFLD